MQRERKSGGEGVDLTESDYERLRRAARTYREVLVVRLCGEVGLRPPEVTRIGPDDFEARTTRVGTHHLLAVPDGEGDTARHAYVPAPVRAAVRRYAREQSVDDDEPLVDVSARRIQMVVSEVADRAAAEHGTDRLAGVSSADLCRYYARRLVDRKGVDPRVVRAVGPWESLDTLCRHLDAVDADRAVDAFERAAVAGPTAVDPVDEIGRAVDEAAFGVAVVDAEGVIEYANDELAALVGADGDLAGRTVGSLYAADGPDPPTTTEGPTPTRLRRSDGPPVDAVRVALPRPSPDGSDRGHVVALLEADAADEGGSPARAAPERLTAATEVLEGATEVLAAASQRAEVATRVCERLAASDAYEFAWIGSATGDRGVVSTAWDGTDEATAEALAETATEAVGDRSGWTEGVRVLGDERGEAAEATAAAGASDPEAPAVAFAPVVYGDTTHGLLALGAEADAFGDDERRVLASLGWQIGQAMTDVERRNLLLADSVTELEFRVESEAAFFVAASDRLGGRFELQGLVPGENQTLLYFVRMGDTTPEAVFDFAEGVDSIENARLIRDYGETYLVEFVVGGEQPATTLTELGGQVTAFTAEDGAQRVTAEFTTETDVRAVFNGFRSSFPDVSLFSKREVERPVQTTDGFRRSLEDDLTDKQQSVLRAAYLAGYFEWPRGSTAEELADSIGVSSPTLHNHLRKAQQKLLTAFFDDDE